MKAWYFSENPPRLRYGDGREIKAGITHTVDCKPVLCRAGLHGSVRPLDALEYAPGPHIWRVELGGEVVRGEDKAVATERAYLWGYDATKTLRKFARLCALDVIHLWDAPKVVVRYLQTGDEDIRAAARAATWAATWAATGAAARAATWAATGAGTGDAEGAAARAAARAATGAAAWAATRAGTGAGTWAATGAAARAAALASQNKRLYRMLMNGRSE